MISIFVFFFEFRNDLEIIWRKTSPIITPLNNPYSSNCGWCIVSSPVRPSSSACWCSYRCLRWMVESHRLFGRSSRFRLPCRWWLPPTRKTKTTRHATYSIVWYILRLYYTKYYICCVYYTWYTVCLLYVLRILYTASYVVRSVLYICIVYTMYRIYYASYILCIVYTMYLIYYVSYNYSEVCVL